MIGFGVIIVIALINVVFWALRRSEQSNLIRIFGRELLTISSVLCVTAFFWVFISNRLMHALFKGSEYEQDFIIQLKLDGPFLQSEQHFDSRPATFRSVPVEVT